MRIKNIEVHHKYCRISYYHSFNVISLVLNHRDPINQLNLYCHNCKKKLISEKINLIALFCFCSFKFYFAFVNTIKYFDWSAFILSFTFQSKQFVTNRQFLLEPLIFSEFAFEISSF